MQSRHTGHKDGQRLSAYRRTSASAVVWALLCLAAVPALRAEPVSFLTVSGRLIVTPDGKPFVIQGVALDARIAVQGGYGRTPEELARYFRGLGLNTFRLTFNCTQQAVGDFADYLEQDIAPVVAAGKAAGMRTILDMHEYQWSAADQATPGFRGQWLAAWRMVARRYADEPAVAAYELWNEPDIVYGSRQEPAEHRAWLTEAIRAVREIDTRHILIVNGVQGGFGPQTPITWGADPSYDPSRPAITFSGAKHWRNPDPAKRLAFAFHCGFFDTNRALGPGILPYHIVNHRVIVDAFCDAHRVPVIMTEWEDEPPDTATREFMLGVAEWLREDPRRIGWLLWRLHPADELNWWQQRFAKERPAERWHIGELDPPFADVWLGLVGQ
jgi:hypothetical protein